MNKLTLTLAALAVAAPATVFAATNTEASAPELSVGTVLGSSEDAVRTALTDMGFEVRRIDDEGGKIEAYVVKGKTMAEVYVDPTTGKIVKGPKE